MRAASLFAVLATGVTCALAAAPAQAQRDRVFVASYGSDTNPCTYGSPCKTFLNAINVVAVGGEVTAIDSAGFGPIVISHAITITGPSGLEAGVTVTASGASGITINAGPNDNIVLSGLTLDGSGAANTTGIAFNSGASLHVDNCRIRNFAFYGIDAVPNVSSQLFVSNTLISNFTNASGTGINIVPSAGSVAAVLNHVDILNVQGTAVNAGANASVTLRDSTFSGNTAGVNIATDATVVSYGNNAITGNTTNVVGGTIPELGARGPTGPQGVAGPAGPTGPQGTTVAVGAAGATGAAGAQGAQGPQGATGIVSVTDIGGEGLTLNLSNLSFAFIGPTLSIFLTQSQNITVTSSATFTTNDQAVFVEYTICQELVGTGGVLSAGNGASQGLGFSLKAGGLETPAAVSMTFTSPPTGHFQFGPCVQVLGGGNIEANSVSGWVMVTN